MIPAEPNRYLASYALSIHQRHFHTQLIYAYDSSVRMLILPTVSRADHAHFAVDNLRTPLLQNVKLKFPGNSNRIELVTLETTGRGLHL
jgi:hypothetical protein